jgi:hypothetical protein
VQQGNRDGLGSAGMGGLTGGASGNRTDILPEAPGIDGLARELVSTFLGASAGSIAANIADGSTPNSVANSILQQVCRLFPLNVKLVNAFTRIINRSGFWVMQLVALVVGMGCW